MEPLKEKNFILEVRWFKVKYISYILLKQVLFTRTNNEKKLNHFRYVT